MLTTVAHCDLDFNPVSHCCKPSALTTDLSSYHFLAVECWNFLLPPVRCHAFILRTDYLESNYINLKANT